MTTEPTRYYLRCSKPEDLDKLLDFYEMNAHKNVLKRDYDLFKARIDDGSVVLLEDEAGKVVASTITYPFVSENDKGVENVKWQEIGTLRCVLNGYGILAVVVSAQTMRSFLVEPPSDRYIAHMLTTPVQNMAKDLGFREFSPEEELFELKAKMVPGSNDPEAKVNWYQMGIEGIPGMAKVIADVMENPVLENRKTHEKIVIDFSRSSFFQMFSEELKKIAANDLGSVDKPDFKKGVKGQQKKVLQDLYR